MATLKQRLHRKNASGTYDTIHFESASDLILRPSGRTVEQDLTDYLPEVQDSDNVPQSLSKLIIGNTKGFIRGKALSVEGHTHTEYAASSHNHSANNITSGTLPVTRGGTGVTSNPSLLVNLASTSAASVFTTSPRPGVTGTLPVSKGGTGVTTVDALRTMLNLLPSVSSLISGDLTSLGSLVTMNNTVYRVVHVSKALGEAVIMMEYSDTAQRVYWSGQYATTYTTYDGTEAFNACDSFCLSLPDNIRKILIPKNIHGATQKVWIPEALWVYGGLSGMTQSYLKSKYSVNEESGSWNTTFQYFDGKDTNYLKFKDTSGYSTSWWTATGCPSSYVYYITSDGSRSYDSVNGRAAIRVFMAVPLE